MRKSRHLSKAQSKQQLLQTLIDSPALPGFVRNLQTPVLKRLIEHVGLHDAGDLIALTTPEQMRDLFEVSLWESLTPGQAERLRPEKFLEWLDVMLEVSPAFAAQRLIELGDDFVVINFAPLLEVIDATVTMEHQEEGSCLCGLCMLVARDASFELIGEHIVVGIHDDEWDAIRTTLVELEGEDAAFLYRVLSRISTAPTVRRFPGSGATSDAADTLLDDETYEREQRRERSGFVTPQIAAVFLKTTRQTARADLVAQREYDTITQRYFEQLAAAASAPTEPDEPAEEIEPDEPVASAVQMRALEEALVQAEVIGGQTMLLAGPQNSKEPTLELQLRLDQLQLTQPDLFAARLSELIYLANVLMAGSWYQGGRFTESEAARAALSCANLGLDAVLAAAVRSEAADDILAAPPGIVRLFQVGWNELSSLPLRSAVALLDALRAGHVREKLRHKRWILDEIESAVTEPDMLDLIEQGEFDDVGDNLTLLGLVLDQRACQCLRTLIGDFPRFPLQLNLGFKGTSSTNEVRYLATLGQLHAVESFLDGIDELLRI
jgi:hypothetical protein